MRGSEGATSNGAVPAALPANEAARLRSLASYQVVDTLPEDVYDDLVFLAGFICQTPIALISLVDEKRQFFKAGIGLPVRETPRDLAFCAHAILQNQPFIVNDATADERFAHNPLVTGDPQIRFYVGIPLLTPEGLPLGTLCAIDRKPRDLSPEQARALSVLARQVMVQLELRRVMMGLESSFPESTRRPTQSSTSLQVAPSTPPFDVNVDIAAERARTLLGQGAAGGPMGDRIRSLLARFEELASQSQRSASGGSASGR
jgi:hypothetical protein